MIVIGIILLKILKAALCLSCRKLQCLARILAVCKQVEGYGRPH